jgi:hypothetical protein
MGSVPINYGGGDSSVSSSSDSRTKKAVSAAGRSLSASGQSMISSSRDEAASNVRPVQYARGGKVRKTGPAVVHRGERVIPKSKVKRVEKLMRKNKVRMKDRGR